MKRSLVVPASSEAFKLPRVSFESRRTGHVVRRAHWGRQRKRDALGYAACWSEAPRETILAGHDPCPTTKVLLAENQETNSKSRLSSCRVGSSVAGVLEIRQWKDPRRADRLC